MEKKKKIINLLDRKHIKKNKHMGFDLHFSADLLIIAYYPWIFLSTKLNNVGHSHYF